MPRPIFVSATQIANFRSCPRKWFFRSVLKQPEPTTDALIFGDRFSKAVEAKLKGLAVPTFDPVTDATLRRFLEAANLFYPAPNPSIYAEEKVEFPVGQSATMIGYLDVLDLSGDEVVIRDHKTRADKRYAPSAVELATDLQLNIYAAAMFRRFPEAQTLSVGHINYVKPPKGRAADLPYILHEWEPVVFLRHTPLDRLSVVRNMSAVEREVEQMVALSDPTIAPENTPFDTTERACFAYNRPCPYAGICPKGFMLKTPPRPPSSTAPATSTPPPPPMRPPAPPAPAVAAPPAPAPASVRRTAPPPPPLSSRTAPPPPSVHQGDQGINPVSPTAFGEGTPWTDNPIIIIEKIPGVTAKVTQQLKALGLTHSLEVAHLTLPYLRAAGMSVPNSREILKLADEMRNFHEVLDPDPWACCPPLAPVEAGEASPQELAAPLPPHAGTPPLEATPPKIMPLPVGSVPPHAAPKRKPAPTTQPFVLYIDCAPVKGVGAALFEDWIAPMLEGVAEANNQPHWRAVTEYGVVANTLASLTLEALNSGNPIPAHLVVLSPYAEPAKFVLDLLIQRASVVVRR